jgi:PucR family transcriptional regulator, purine catabolism regulatory protein
MLTVGDLLRDLELEPLAGEQSLDVAVRWVHISELLDPTPWLSGGEVLLTTGMSLESPEAQREFLTRLADHGLAGVGLGVGFAHAKAPDELVAAARERDFPLFEVPYATPFIAVTEKAAAAIVSEHYAALRRSIAAQERLQQVVLSERGLDGITATLASLVGGSALVLDPRGGVLAQATFQRALDDAAAAALAQAVTERSAPGAEPFVPDDEDLRVRSLALPVLPSQEGAPPEAWLVAIKDAGGLAEFDRLVLHQAVSVVALELLRRRVASSTERRLAGDILAEALSRQLAGAKLARRLEPFGLGGQVSALVFAGDETVGSVTNVEAAVGEALEDEGVSALVAADGPLVAALLPGFLDEELFALASRLLDGVTERAGQAVRVAAGRGVPAGDARRAYTEARCALEARAMTGGRNGASGEAPVATYRDLGSFALLLSLQDSDALARFCDSVLGPIENGDARHGDELVRSLSVFLDENGHWERAARRLYCHRHTLRYRMRKVEELTGRDLGTAGDRIELWLALKARELL